MKKAIILAGALSISVAAHAQKGKVNSANSFLSQGLLDKAKEQIDIDLAAQDENTVQWDKAWFTRGRIYQSLAESPLPMYNELEPDAPRIALEAYRQALKFTAMDKNAYEDEVRDQLPGIKDLYFNTGVQAYQNGQQEPAYEAFRACVAIDSLAQAATKDTLVYYLVGETALNVGKPEVAVPYLQVAADLGFDGALSTLATAYSRQGMVDKAEQILTDALAKDPTNGDLLIQVVNFYLIDKDDPEKAIGYIDEVIEKDPENVSFWHAKGVTHNKLGQVDQEREAYQKALSIDPNFYPSLYNLGAVYINQASVCFTAANQIPPSQAAAYDAKVAEGKKNLSDAEPFLARALEQKPDDVDVMRALIEVYVKTQQYDKANTLKARIDELEGGE